MRWSLLVLAAAFVGGFAPVAARADSVCNRGPTRDWRDGPARYLLTEDEWSRYGRLETESARAAFVTRFWKRLDSGGAASEESFRQRFRERCLEVERRYIGDEPPGWRSDRGRVLLLLGEPATVERLPGEAESIAREVWVYPYPFGGPSSSLRIPFYHALDGRIRLEPPRPKTNVGTPVVYDAVRGRARTTSRFSGPLPGSAFGAKIDAIIYRPAVELPPRPPTAALPPGSTVTEDSALSSALRDGIWFFQASDGTALALLAVTLAAGSGLDETSVRGSVFVLEGAASEPGAGTAQSELSAMPAPADDRPVYVGRVLLEPGVAARIRYAFTDASRRTMLVRSRTVEVPELGTGGFSVSSVVPAESFGPRPPGVESVFAVGSETVVPRLEASFARGETLRLYLQFYGAHIDPVSAHPRVDVEFVFRREDGRRSRRHGPPFRLRGAFGASLGLSIPIGDWPAGAYRVEVRLHDRLAGRTVTAGERFRVTE